MEIELLKHKFHILIDNVDNPLLLEHFYEIIYNLQISKEKDKQLLNLLESDKCDDSYII